MEATQATRIYRAIKDSGKKGIENYKLSPISLRYGSRIMELREDGHNIVAERQVINGRYTGVWMYYLSSEDAKPRPKKYKSNELIRELMIAKSKGRFGAFNYINNRLKELNIQ